MKSRYIVVLAMMVIGSVAVSGCDMSENGICNVMNEKDMSGADENNMEPGDNFVMMGDSVYDSVLRFHVLANSDSNEDQKVKLKVKDAVTGILAKDMKERGIATKEQAYEYVTDNMNRYIETASEVIKKEGYSYEARGEVTHCWFPVKVYGNYVFPAGEYDAFRILIGKAEGKNWWCVLFPSLCMVDEAYMVADTDAVTDTVKDTDDSAHNGTDVKFRLRIVEWLQNMW